MAHLLTLLRQHEQMPIHLSQPEPNSQDRHKGELAILTLVRRNLCAEIGLTRKVLYCRDELRPANLNGLHAGLEDFGLRFQLVRPPLFLRMHPPVFEHLAIYRFFALHLWCQDMHRTTSIEHMSSDVAKPRINGRLTKNGTPRSRLCDGGDYNDVQTI